MSEKYILRVGRGGKPMSLYHYHTQSSTYQKYNIDDWRADELKNKALIILLPLNWMYHGRTHVASKSTDLLKKSIPFAIEEELSNDVEANYFAFQLNTDGSQDVVAIEKEKLNGIVNEIELNQLQVSAIYSEQEWLPAKQDVITIWQDKEYALIRFGTDPGMSVQISQLSQLIPLFKGNIGKVNCNTHAADFEQFGVTVDSDLDEASCCEHVISSKKTDLYIEEIKNPAQKQVDESWKSVKILTVVLIVSWLVIQIYQLIKLDTSIENIKSEQQQLFKQAFPDAAPAELVDPFAGIKSRLQLSSSQSDNQSVFLDAIYYISLSAKRIAQVSIKGFRLVDSQVELQITAPNMTVINNFHQELEKNAYEFNVKIGINELSDNNLYKSILTMVPR